MSHLYFKGLGDGWAPAVFESFGEYYFIKEGQAGNRIVTSYWIGGSTNFIRDRTIKYSSYLTHVSGNHIVWLCSSMSLDSGIPFKNYF